MNKELRKSFEQLQEAYRERIRLTQQEIEILEKMIKVVEETNEIYRKLLNK